MAYVIMWRMSKPIPHKKTKAILFDLGNVILDFDFTPAFRKLSGASRRPAEEIKAFFFASGLEVLYDGGKISSRQFYAHVKKELKHGLDYTEFKKIWNEIFTLNREIANLIERLRPHYRLVLISNTNAMHYEHARLKYPVLRHFDQKILSFKEKVRKPDERIYRKAIRACRAAAGEIFYIDDREDLTEAASALGLKTFTYKNNVKALTKKMKKAGIL